MRDEAVRHNFHAALARKDHREDHFYRFLRFRVSVKYVGLYTPAVLDCDLLTILKPEF